MEFAKSPSSSRWDAFNQLVLSRIRGFVREKEALFWVLIFPMLMTLALGIAFREKKIEEVVIDIERSSLSAELEQRLSSVDNVKVRTGSAEECELRLRTGRTSLIVRTDPAKPEGISLLFDETRPDSHIARLTVENLLLKKSTSPIIAIEKYDQLGGRYIDFLVPGLLGMGIMGGGLFGLGFVSVDLRIKKLLKLFLATPMRKSDFLLSLMVSRFLFMVPEILVLLLFSYLIFGVKIYGSFMLVLLLIIVGAWTFSGIGLLTGSRARTLEAASGLMNLVMLPMWILSGIFFSSDRFPDAIQPVIKSLPLTMLIDALRGVMNEAKTLMDVLPHTLGLLGWGFVTFFIGLKIFRWQ